MPQNDARRADRKSSRRARNRRRRFAGQRRHRDPRCSRAAGGEGDPEPFVSLGSGPRRRRSRFGRIRKIDRAGRAGAGLAFERRNPHFQRAGRAIPLHPPHPGAPVASRGDDLRSGSTGERSGRSAVRQPETHRSAFHRLSGLVGDLHRQPARGSPAHRVDRAFPFRHLDLEDGRVLTAQCRRDQKERYSADHKTKWRDRGNTLRKRRYLRPGISAVRSPKFAARGLDVRFSVTLCLNKVSS